MATPTNDSTAGGDLLPTIPSQRTSTAWDISSLWISMVIGIPSYYIAGSLVEKGMSWWQGLLIIFSAKALLLFPLLLTGHMGALYGLPFPVLARASFGVHGALVPSLLRSLVACGWFGVETWIGGQAVFLLLPNAVKSSSFSSPVSFLGISLLEFACFLAFWAAQLVVLWKGMGGIRKMERFSAPILLLFALLLLSWAYLKVGGFGPMLYKKSKLDPSQFWALFFPSLTANVGSWGAVAVSISDFTRYARRPADQVLGQLGLPVFMATFAFVGLAVTSSTHLIFGRTISNPITLLAEISSGGGGGAALTRILSIPAIALVVVTTNIPANIVAPANALVSLNPKFFTFRRGALLTSLVGIALQPWRIFRSPDSFVYTWLVSYSAVMGPLSGIMLTDYYIVRRRVLNVGELYSWSCQGEYYHTKGYNVVAMASLVVGVAPTVPGFLHKVGILEAVPAPLGFIHDVSWFFGFFVASLAYGVLSLWLGGRRKNNGGGVAVAPATATAPLLLFVSEATSSIGGVSCTKVSRN